MELKNLITKIHALPEANRKIILFSIVGFIGCFLLAGTLISTQHRFASLRLSTEYASGLLSPQNEGLREERLSSNVVEPLEENITDTDSPFANPIVYQNKVHAFSLYYPEGWVLDEKKSTNEVVIIEKISGDFVAHMKAEVIPRGDSESAMDQSLGSMNTILVPKSKINIGGVEGYEALGTTCTDRCDSIEQAVYSPFALLYIADHDTVLKIKYGEGILGRGWKPSFSDWTEYQEFKHIISTLSFQ